MPHTVTAQCKVFVNEYADLIIELLTNEISPKEMCVALNICDKASKLISSKWNSFNKSVIYVFELLSVENSTWFVAFY